MKFPYGIGDFASLITEQYHYVDRTGHIPLLEEAGKQLLSLRALPAVQAKQREAEVGLARYREKLHRKFGDVLRLKSFSVVAVGFERLVSDGW